MWITRTMDNGLTFTYQAIEGIDYKLIKDNNMENKVNGGTDGGLDISRMIKCGHLEHNGNSWEFVPSSPEVQLRIHEFFKTMFYKLLYDNKDQKQ
jgi:hypothetical protein